jgi:phosphohistidine phosphatase
MDLFILRHGIAEERDPQRYPDDGRRPLTADGKRKLKKISLFLKKTGYGFDLVLTSPLARARQTAEIAASVLGIESRLRETPHLAPSGDPRRLVAEIASSRRQSVLLVGHEPYLSGFISVLLSGRQGLGINLKKGGFCHLSAESPRYGACAVIHALYPPKSLTALL